MRAVDILRNEQVSRQDMARARRHTAKRVRLLIRHKAQGRLTGRKIQLFDLLEKRLAQIGV